MLLLIDTTVLHNGLGSKPEAKFRTFWSSVKFRGGVGEISKSVLRIQPRTKPLDGALLGRL